MSSFLNLSQFGPALKTIYPQGVPESLTLKDHPFWARLRKVQDFYGQNLKLPFRFADPMSVSRTFTSALNLRTAAASQYANVQLTRGHQFGVVTIDRETILASMNDSGAFLNARKAEIDGMINQLGNRLSQDMFGDGSGILGSVSFVTSGSPTFQTLADPNQIVNFEVGQFLNVTATVPTVGAAATLIGSQGAYVVAIDRDAGNISLSSTYGGAAAYWNSLTGWTGLTNGTTYYLLQNADNTGFSATSTTSAVAGLAAWIPSVAPTSSDTFFGITLGSGQTIGRSVDADRLGGIRFTGTGLPIEEAVNRAAYRVARDGGRPDSVVMNYAQLANLQTSLGAKVRYVDFNGSGPAATGISFSAFQIPGPKGALTVYADGNCPTGSAYMIQQDCWSFHHLSGAPELITMGNVQGVLQESSLDALQVRAACYGQLMCDAPGYNAVISLDT